MKRVVLFLVAMVLAACGIPDSRAPDRIHDATQIESATVALVHGTAGQVSVYPFCSGVWVSSTTILTAAHCVHDSEVHDTVQYVVHDDVTPMPETPLLRTAKLYARDAAHDLALLRALDAPAHRSAQTRRGAIAQGMFTQAMGHSLGLWYSYSSGDVAALRIETEDNGVQTWFVQTTAPISPGNSGGGLFDIDGRLLGVAHGFYPRGENLNMFVHKTHVDALLVLQGEDL